MTLRMQKDIFMDVIIIRPNCCLGLLGWGSFCSLPDFLTPPRSLVFSIIKH